MRSASCQHGADRAFAAERRRMPHGRRAAIERYLLPVWRSAANPPHAAAAAIDRLLLLFLFILLAHQQKAAGRKTRLDIQNYGCNGNLLCYHGVVGRNRISSLQSHEKALEKECCNITGIPRVKKIIIIINIPGSKN